MTKLKMIALGAASALALSAGAAAAQSWVDDRYDAISDKIDQAVSSGAISPTEAASLRDELGDVGATANSYRDVGMSSWETTDLTRRFDSLSSRVDDALADSPQPMGWYGGAGWTDRSGAWMSVEARKAELDRRIEAGLRSGDLTPTEAARLRMRFNDIARLEARYSVGGLSAWERGDLDRRFDQLADAITLESRDRQYGYGYGWRW